MKIVHGAVDYHRARMIVPVNCPRCGSPIHYRAPEEPTAENAPKFRCEICGHMLTEPELVEQAQGYARKLMMKRVG